MRPLPERRGLKTTDLLTIDLMLVGLVLITLTSLLRRHRVLSSSIALLGTLLQPPSIPLLYFSLRRAMSVELMRVSKRANGRGASSWASRCPRRSSALLVSRYPFISCSSSPETHARFHNRSRKSRPSCRAHGKGPWYAGRCRRPFR